MQTRLQKKRKHTLTNITYYKYIIVCTKNVIDMQLAKSQAIPNTEKMGSTKHS